MFLMVVARKTRMVAALVEELLMVEVVIMVSFGYVLVNQDWSLFLVQYQFPA
jgi:hypothetical protein